jgi:hypothetical protein
MTTAATIVNNALIALGVQNELNPPDEYLQEQGFKALIRMLNRWAGIPVGLAVTIPAVPADELGEPESTTEAVETSLAIAMQRIAKVTASNALRRDQKIAYRDMKAAFGLWPEQSMPSSMPLGTGNNLGPRTKRFFPNVETVGADSDTSLGI